MLVIEKLGMNSRKKVQAVLNSRRNINREQSTEIFEHRKYIKRNPNIRVTVENPYKLGDPRNT